MIHLISSPLEEIGNDPHLEYLWSLLFLAWAAMKFILEIITL